MKKTICYYRNKLESLLNRHTLKTGDYFSEEDYSEPTKYSKMYFISPDVESVEEYSGLFSNSMMIKLQDGSVIEALGDNINVDDTEQLRINHNPYCSPYILCDNFWIEASDKFNAWIHQFYPEINAAQLQEISREFNIFEVYEYPGVSTPMRDRSGEINIFSSKNLILDEREIDTALNSIQDDMLRAKIRAILLDVGVKKIPRKR